MVRGIPKIEWYLRIRTPDGVKEYQLPDGNPIYEQPLTAFDNGIVNKKWFDFEGKLPPRTTYNPNKKIASFMSPLDKGTVDLDTTDEANVKLTFHGKKLKGQWTLVQEEAKSDTWTLQRLSEEDLFKSTFVLQKHYGDKIESHWDVRISEGFEFNIYGDPTKIAVGSSVHSVKKNISDVKTLREKWMIIDKPHTFRLVGPLATYVDPIDKGGVNVIENSENFVSMKFHGDKLSGYFVYKKASEGKGGQFEHSKLPQPLSDGSPKSSAYDPFKVIKKAGWDYYWLEIFDMREFTRCVVDHKEYLPDISKPAEVQDILVCLYQVPGEIHHARVSRIKVSDAWTPEQATSWIKENKLHTWDMPMIRKGEPKKEPEKGSAMSDDEIDKTFNAILEQIRNQGKHKDEEKEKLDKELKKKKIELINAWLEAQKEK